MAGRFWVIARSCALSHTVDEMSSEDTSPPDLQAAADKLAVAVEHLEERLDGLFERLESSGSFYKEAAALRMDRTRLARDLDAARARERELQRLADEASEALGAAISEVRGALGKV